MSIGIYDCFGYGKGYDVPFRERYRLIKSAGFDCVMLWWSDQFGRGAGYREDAQLAKEAGLQIENMHAPVHEQNDLFLDDPKGESVFQCYLQCVRDCAAYQIPTVVIHLPDDRFAMTRPGMERLGEIIGEAEKQDVKVAFENLNNLRNLAMVLEAFSSVNAGFCYDSCHHSNYAPESDLLGLYGNRLFALHLHDNGGKNNQHQLPFDGNIDWEKVMSQIAAIGYRGATTLEPMNWDYTEMSIEQYLSEACRRARKLDSMR